MNAMKSPFVSILLLLATATASGDEPAARRKVVLVIHGGAGVRPRAKMTPELQGQYEAALKTALRAGYDALRRDDGTSLDAVEAAIKVLEDSPLFNAGK